MLPTRGLKVLDVLAVAEDGTPVGLLDLEWWARSSKSSRSRHARRRTGETETTHWVDVVGRTAGLVHECAPACEPWFVIDREGDCADILRAVAQPGQRFTIRATQNRRVLLPNGGQRPLLKHMHKQRVLGVHVVDVPAGPNRRARRAVLDVRFANVVLELPDHATGRRTRASRSHRLGSRTTRPAWWSAARLDAADERGGRGPRERRRHRHGLLLPLARRRLSPNVEARPLQRRGHAAAHHQAASSGGLRCSPPWPPASNA